MPQIESVTTLFEAIGRSAEELIGLAENEWLDFKREPYHLDDVQHRLALAKDVSAMANAGEGVIVIGVDTRVDERSMQEIASALRPIALGVVDPQRVQAVIHDWVWPRLDVEVREHAIGSGPGLLWTILVRIQRDRDLPFLVAKEFLASSGPDRYAFGLYRRHSADNLPYSPSQVHQWIHDGYTSAVGATPPAADFVSLEEAAAVLDDDVSALAQPENTAYYYLQAKPTVPATLGRFYRGDTGSMFDALAATNQLRSHGFNLPEGRPELTSWDGLRVVEPPNVCLSVSRHGTATAILGRRVLTWATERLGRQGRVYINPLALIEFTLEFWRFYAGQVATRLEQNTSTLWRAGMIRVGDPAPLYLPGGALQDFGHLEASRAPVESFDLPWQQTEQDDSEVLALSTLVEIYARFGWDRAQVPYVEGDRIAASRIMAQGIR